LAAHRLEAARLRVEQAQLDLDRQKGELVTRGQVMTTMGGVILQCRQRLLHLPGRVKTTLGLSLEQTIGLQKEIRAALTDLAEGKGAATGRGADPSKGVPL
jgi:hypothetical protein